MHTPIVSIAMTTYNGERYLQEQLDSLMAQTRPPDELIVSDDGSTDNTVAVVEAFRKVAQFPVRLNLNEENLGYIENFQHAVRLARGDIIFLSDQDDVWFDKKIEAHLEVYAQNANVQVVTNDALGTDDSLKVIGSLLAKTRPQKGAAEKFVGNGCCLSFKAGFGHLCFPMPHPNTSYDLWMHRVATKLDVRAVLKTPLQYYRRHEANASPAHYLRSPLKKLWLRVAHRLRKLKFQDILPELQDKLNEASNLLERLEISDISVDRHGNVLRVAEAISGEAQVLKARISILRRPRPFRLPAVLRAYRRGDYKAVAGARSALKDVLR